MSRPRRKDRHLPPCVYLKHGAYYLVRAGQWKRIGATLSEALAEYARLIEPTGDSVGALLTRVLQDAEGRVAPSTLSQYKLAAAKIRTAFVEFRADQVKPHHIGAFMDHHKATPNMANRMRTVLKMAFDLAVRSGQLNANPVTSIGRHKERVRTRYLTDDEYMAIRAAANEDLRAIMDMLYCTAQRVGDVLKIREQHITEEGVEIDQQKTSHRLVIRWTPDLRAAVAFARSLHGPAHRLYLLGQRNGRLRGYAGVWDLWDRACAAAGVEDANIHDIRAKSLTDAARQGLDAQHLAGHTTQAMTARYLRSKERDAVTGPSFRQFPRILDSKGSK